MALSCLPKRSFLSIQIAAAFTAFMATSPLAYADSLAQRAGSIAASIRIGGSSTVFPIMAEAIRAFREAGNSTKIDLKETGTSDGFRRFCAGQLEIVNASRPINSKELKACSSNRINVAYRRCGQGGSECRRNLHREERELGQTGQCHDNRLNDREGRGGKEIRPIKVN